jgi:hypothetical protein
VPKLRLNSPTSIKTRNFGGYTPIPIRGTEESIGKQDLKKGGESEDKEREANRKKGRRIEEGNAKD